MKHLLYILLLLVLASCRTTRTVTREQETTIQQRDSVVLRDSVVIRYITTTRDSIVIRDSVVIIKDTTGRVIGTERYRISERVRDRLTDNTTIAKNLASRDNIKKEQAKTIKTDSKSVRFSLTALIRILGLFILFTLITIIVLKIKRLWRWW